jgi:hypothetical protein
LTCVEDTRARTESAHAGLLTGTDYNHTRALWQPAPAADPPTYKAWVDMIEACLSDAPNGRDLAEHAVGRMSFGDPEGYTTGAVLLCGLGLRPAA